MTSSNPVFLKPAGFLILTFKAEPEGLDFNMSMNCNGALIRQVLKKLPDVENTIQHLYNAAPAKNEELTAGDVNE
ncbi:MAG: hypothetical protein LBU81_02830 [Methanosarcinales archaeon]|jgi:hypothetical protein|nr:hypothetical protein [Methanosarcinales archaeon]